LRQALLLLFFREGIIFENKPPPYIVVCKIVFSYVHNHAIVPKKKRQVKTAKEQGGAFNDPDFCASESWAVAGPPRVKRKHSAVTSAIAFAKYQVINLASG